MTASTPQPSTPVVGREGVAPVRVDEMRAPPVVGQFYLVPTVRGVWHGHTSAWPVMGPKHEDPELNFVEPHYHIDVRFLSARQCRVMNAAYAGSCARERVSDDTPTYALAAGGAPLTSHYAPMRPVEYRRLRCREVGHHYPAEFALSLPPFPRLHEAYAGRRCGRDAGGRLICPHKGFALDTLVPDAEGRVVCPLHGLVIDLASATVAPTPSEASRVPQAIQGGEVGR